MNSIFWTFTILTLFPVTNTAVVHLNLKNYIPTVSTSPFTIVYFYSSSCNYCKQFTPVFQKMEKSGKFAQYNITFAKIDGPAYQNLTHSLQVFSYPNLLIYRQGVSLPLMYRRERSEKQLTAFIKKFASPGYQNQYKQFMLKATSDQLWNEKLAVFYGKNTSQQFWRWDVIAKRDGFITWVFEQSEQTKVKSGSIQISAQQLSSSSDLTLVEKKVNANFARLHSVSEQGWLKMAQRKIFTIVYFNKFSNKKNKQLLQELATKIPQVHFLQIDGQHEQFKNALNFVGLPNDQYLVSVDKKYDAVYVAQPPYTQQSLRTFIQKAKDHKLELYRKTQKSDKMNKLTRTNYQQKMNTNQDVLLFLYQKSSKSSKDMMKLFQFLVAKLKNNKNLLLLRCDVSMNQIDQLLGFITKPTPRVVFFRNRMKDHPIHFNYKTVSPQTVIEFIMQNTTFDFEDEWAEL